MFYTITKIKDLVFDGQEQSHFVVSMFEDEEKTISAGQQMLVVSGEDRNNPEAAFLNGMNSVITRNTNYAVLRANAYPSVQDQLDTLYHGGYDAWKAEIQAVKDQFPKE